MPHVFHVVRPIKSGCQGSNLIRTLPSFFSSQRGNDKGRVHFPRFLASPSLILAATLAPPRLFSCTTEGHQMPDSHYIAPSTTRNSRTFLRVLLSNIYALSIPIRVTAVGVVLPGYRVVCDLTSRRRELAKPHGERETRNKLETCQLPRPVYFRKRRPGTYKVKRGKILPARCKVAGTVEEGGRIGGGSIIYMTNR